MLYPQLLKLHCEYYLMKLKLQQLNLVEFRLLVFVSGDIGGQLGLFVGASFITCCEILVYFFKKIMQWFNTRNH